MPMQDFMLALTSNISAMAFWLALATTVLGVLCLVGLFSTSREFEEIEMLGLIRTFIPLSLIFWGLSALPGIKDVKNVHEQFKPAPKHTKKKEVKNEKSKGTSNDSAANGGNE